jgi:hypothetical protein
MYQKIITVLPEITLTQFASRSLTAVVDGSANNFPSVASYLFRLAPPEVLDVTSGVREAKSVFIYTISFAP